MIGSAGKEKRMKPAVSVVIPVFNCGEMFSKCIASLQKQTFEDFEVILVDNGSTDGSEKLASETAVADSRFRVLHQLEGRAGAARNAGVAAAQGEFIAFIDGDDTVSANYLAELYRAVKDHHADISLCGYDYYFLSDRSVRKGICLPDRSYTRDEALGMLLQDRKIKFYLWGRLFRRSLFTEHGITIRDMYYEDAAVVPQLFYFAAKAVSVSGCAYHYTRGFSKYAEVNMSVQRANDYVNTIPLIRLFLEQQGCFEQFRGKLMNHVFHVYFAMPSVVRQIKETTKKNDRRNIRDARAKIRLCLRCSYEKLQTLKLNIPVVE